MNVKNYRTTAYKKVLFSLGIVIIYLLGSNIVIPGINVGGIFQAVNASDSTALILSITGLSLNQISLFSLGLGPWMSALIFWRVLMVTKMFHIQSLTEAQSYRFKFVFSLLLAGLQSFTIISQAKLVDHAATIPSWYLMVILVSGLSILIWLGNLNTQYGIGGPTIIILVSILRSWPHKVIEVFSSQSLGEALLQFIPGVLLLLLGSYFVFRFYQGEKRLTINHIMLDLENSQQSYLPIPTNPAGGMPFMFAFSLVLFPQYLVFLLQQFFTTQPVFDQIYQEIQLDHVLGVLILVLSVVVLTYGFSYVNIDYKDLASSFRKSGDYFTNVYPGKNTERYLFHEVSRSATVAAIVNGLIVGVPMLVAIYYPKVSMWAYLISTWMIVMILIREICIQFLSVYHRNDYQGIL